MITRDKLLSRAINECMKDLYKYVYPRVSWKNFIKECKEYTNLYNVWKELEPRPDIEEYCGPQPFEFYYLPREIMKDVTNSYIHVYRIDKQQELLDTIGILKNYCKEPIIDKYIKGELREDGTRWPGHRGYEHPDNLEKEINTYLDLKFPLMDPERAEDSEDFENKLNIAAKELQDKFFEFLDMAGNFYNWNRDLNCFSMSVYLGVSPCSNKERVIENWKKYRNKDIKINEEKIKKGYYGEEY